MLGGNASMAIASIWTNIANWSTPTILFCVLNLMIAIIFIASNFGNSHHGNSPRNLTRPPSMLEREKSVNLSSFYSTALSEQVNSSELTGSEQVNITKELPRAPSFLDRVKSFKLTSPFKSDFPSDDTFTSQDEQFDVPSDHDVVEDHNDASDNSRYNNLSNVSGQSSMNLAKRSASHLTKSRSEKRVVESANDDNEDFDRRRPATVRESAGAKDECVNAKADDFIQRFKQQLKLQRLDSLQRFRDMLNRGT
ncbi:reverse transcriptase domain-containing protein [Tanacetum coccineum]